MIPLPDPTDRIPALPRVTVQVRQLNPAAWNFASREEMDAAHFGDRVKVPQTGRDEL